MWLPSVSWDGHVPRPSWPRQHWRLTILIRFSTKKYLHKYWQVLQGYVVSINRPFSLWNGCQKPNIWPTSDMQHLNDNAKPITNRNMLNTHSWQTPCIFDFFFYVLYFWWRTAKNLPQGRHRLTSWCAAAVNQLVISHLLWRTQVSYKQVEHSLIKNRRRSSCHRFIIYCLRRKVVWVLDMIWNTIAYGPGICRYVLLTHYYAYEPELLMKSWFISMVGELTINNMCVEYGTDEKRRTWTRETTATVRYYWRIDIAMVKVFSLHNNDLRVSISNFLNEFPFFSPMGVDRVETVSPFFPYPVVNKSCSVEQQQGQYT